MLSANALVDCALKQKEIVENKTEEKFFIHTDELLHFFDPITVLFDQANQFINGSF